MHGGARDGSMKEGWMDGIIDPCMGIGIDRWMDGWMEVGM